MHVKNVAKNDKKGNKIEAENANEKRQIGYRQSEVLADFLEI